MALFELNSDITIGKFRFSSVNEVEINHSLDSITDSAIIKLPSIAKIATRGQAAGDTVITGAQFNDGDPVIVKLGYNNDLHTEFTGFVSKRNMDMPLTIYCEGYSWLLRRNNINSFSSSISVKELLNMAVSGLPDGNTIDVRCDVDMELNNIVIYNKSGFDIVNELMKYTDGCLSCFFIKPNVLWCGMVYTAYANGNDVFAAGSVKYSPGYNLVKNNSLKQSVTSTNKIQVVYNKRLSTGQVLSATSDVYSDAISIYTKQLNHIQDEATLKLLANEKAYRMNYTGYEGSLNAFLQPYAAAGYTSYIQDDRYAKENGTYLIESIAVNFGLSGARRIVEIGPELGFVKT